MEGLIRTATASNKGLMPIDQYRSKNMVETSVSLDSVLTDGTYLVMGGGTVFSEGAILEVSTSNKYVIQKAFPLNSSKIHIRTKRSTSEKFSEWRII